jgi:hypothetical protein
MQREKEIKRQKSGRVKPGCINKEKRKTGYRAIATVMIQIQWEYAKHKYSSNTAFTST